MENGGPSRSGYCRRHDLPCANAAGGYRAVTLRVGESRILLLPGNPTTGYEWSLAGPLPVNAPVSVELAPEAPACPQGKPLFAAFRKIRGWS